MKYLLVHFVSKYSMNLLIWKIAYINFVRNALRNIIIKRNILIFNFRKKECMIGRKPVSNKRLMRDDPKIADISKSEIKLIHKYGNLNYYLPIFIKYDYNCVYFCLIIYYIIWNLVESFIPDIVAYNDKQEQWYNKNSKNFCFKYIPPSKAELDKSENKNKNENYNENQSSTMSNTTNSNISRNSNLVTSPPGIQSIKRESYDKDNDKAITDNNLTNYRNNSLVGRKLPRSPDYQSLKASKTKKVDQDYIEETYHTYEDMKSIIKKKNNFVSLRLKCERAFLTSQLPNGENIVDKSSDKKPFSSTFDKIVIIILLNYILYTYKLIYLFIYL